MFSSPRPTLVNKIYFGHVGLLWTTLATIWVTLATIREPHWALVIEFPWILMDLGTLLGPRGPYWIPGTLLGPRGPHWAPPSMDLKTPIGSLEPHWAARVPTGPHTYVF